MKVWVDSNGKPIPGDMLVMGDKMRARQVTPGVVEIGVSGEDAEKTVTFSVSRERTVTKRVTLTSEIPMRSNVKYITAEEEREVSRDRTVRVTNWDGTVTREDLIGPRKEFTTTRDRAGTITREKTVEKYV